MMRSDPHRPNLPHQKCATVAKRLPCPSARSVLTYVRLLFCDSCSKEICSTSSGNSDRNLVSIDHRVRQIEFRPVSQVFCFFDLYGYREVVGLVSFYQDFGHNGVGR